MYEIQTARRSITSTTLGRVLIREHVLLPDMEFTCNYRPDFSTEETAAGVTQIPTDKMFIDNPRRHFERAAARRLARNIPCATPEEQDHATV